jgi:carboxyl-terminal processing protease
MIPSSQSGESYDDSAPDRGLPRWLKLLWVLSLALIVFLAGATAGILVERQQYDGKVVLDDSWQQLGAVISLLERDSYYRPADAAAEEDWQATIERHAIEGMLGGSGDDYAAFLPPKEAAESSARLTGQYEGIGVSIGDGGGEVEVVSVMLDSPAERADIRVGDVIETVSATPIPDGDVDLAASLLRGQAGTDVSLEVSRPGTDSYQVTLTREKISTGAKTVAYRYLPEQDIGVIQIALFASTTTEELDQALKLARADGVERLVLDLRGNPGGWVTSATEVIGRFVDPGRGPALLEDNWPRGGRMVELPIRNDGAPRYDGELIVLVDGNTASAAEIVASSLQYYDRATVVGQQTYGKGSVQRVYGFTTGDSLRLTVAAWFTPGEQPLQGVGVTPDVTVDTTVPVPQLAPALADVFAGIVAESQPPSATPAATPAA